MDASILIPTNRRPALLAHTLASLRSLEVREYDYEILVIDNAGDPETRRVALAGSASLPLRLLVEPTPGKGRALNCGLADAKGALLAFIDDDVLVNPDWLAKLIAGVRRWPQHAVFGGRVLPAWPSGSRRPPDHAFLSHAYAIADWPRREGPYPAGYVYGPNMAIRAPIFRAGWSFDPDLGPNGTGNYVPGVETDLTLRLERAGFLSVYLPGALVFHQIRTEQLRMKWLYGRAFRKGREDVDKDRVSPGPSIRGAPRALWIETGQSYLRYLATRIHPDPIVRLDRAILYWRLRGRVYQCRRGRDRTPRSAMTRARLPGGGPSDGRRP